MNLLNQNAIFPILVLIATSSLARAANISDGIASPYSAPLAQALPFLHPSARKDETPVHLECYDTPGNRFFIGARQDMHIRAPLATVQGVLDDFAHYPELFDGLRKAEVRERAGNRFVVFSEQEVPIPFVPNERNEVIYLVDASPSRVTYLYELRKSNHLKANDGVIVLEALPSGETAYLEFDFWDADWGIAKTFAPDKIWRDNISGLAQADMAVKLRAEHADWNYPRVFEESKKGIDSAGVSACISARKPVTLPKGDAAK